ncbi:MAG TPA: sodium/substrate symporter small subunit, partial [Albitalea sp.]|nr:sodium/substrate symporter small subunit [Albitalea sp.]
MQLTDRHRTYWRRNLRLTAALLIVWCGVTFGVGYFA